VRVLIVEDDEDLLAETAELLAAHGHEPAKATNVPQALALLVSFAPDAVVIDIALPVFDGNYLAAAIAGARRSRPRLIAVTAWLDQVRCELFDAALTKPVAAAELVRALEDSALSGT
jgi:DNA-binding response OmpR family regulator